jgi:hypothetical protein
MRNLLLALIWVVSCWHPRIALSQSIENLKSTFDGEKVTVTYDLIYDNPNQKFNVQLFGSHDNFQTPLSLVMGNDGVGEGVLPGRNKRVIWDVKSEFPSDFNKDVTIKVKAIKMAAAIALNMKPFGSSVYKKGRPIEINWYGGNPTDKINLQLFNKEDKLIWNIQTEYSNDEHLTWTIPQSTSAGKNYYVKLSNASDPSESSKSSFFQVKPRTPFIVKVLPFLAVGGVVYLLTSKSSKTEEPDLPGLTITPN